MSKPAAVVARSNLPNVFRSCLVVFAVLAFSACSLTSSSSGTATLVSPKIPGPKTALKTETSRTAAPEKTAAAPQISSDSLNLGETLMSGESLMSGEALTPGDSVAAAPEDQAPVAVADQAIAPEETQAAAGEAVSAEVMESALATIRKADAQLDLIDRNLCTGGLTGHLTTGQAGQGLLRDNGIKSAYTLTGEIMPAPPSFALAAAEFSDPDPAPSAGTSEAAAGAASFDSAKTSADAKNSAKSGLTESLLMTAYEQTGRHYKSGGQSPESGFDASGFTRWVYGQRGLALPREAAKQAAGGRQVAKDELRPGDLMVYRDGENGGCHVGIYTGQGNFLHADSKTGVVTETAAFGPQFSPYFVGGRRYYDDPQAGPLSDVQKMSATSSAVKLALSELGPEDTLKRPIAKKKPVKTAKKSKAKSNGG